MASGFCWISDWIAAICAGASLPGSTATSFTSLYLPACAFALLVMAAIQPWSAAGAVNPMVTFFPASALFPPDTLVCPLLSLLVSLEVQPASRTPAPSADPPSRNPRREVGMVLTSTVDLRLAPEVGEPELLDEDGADDDRAVDDALRLRRQVVDGEQVGDLAEDEDAEQGAHDRAAAAGESGAADDGRRDGVQFVQVAVGVGARRGLGDHDQRGDAAAQPGQGVEQEGVPLDVDSGEAGGLRVAAHGHGAAAERGAVEQHPADGDDHREDRYDVRETQHLVVGQVVDELHVVDLGTRTGDLLGQSPRGDHHREGRDERHQPPV